MRLPPRPARRRSIPLSWSMPPRWVPRWRAPLSPAIVCRPHCRDCSEQLKQAREREYVAAWREDYAAVKAKRDATAQMLRERYPAIVDELVTLMTNIAITDKEVSRVNLAAPYGDHPRLRGTELTARGLDRFMQPEVSIPQELRLPTFHRDDGPVLAWPPRVPSLAETYVLPPAFLVPVDVEQERLEANRRRHEENARLDALYEKREREAAQRREAERREAAGRP